MPATIAAIDAAYPFGERRNFPYKAWLAERKRAIAVIDRDRTSPRDPLSRRCPACGAAPRKPCRQIGDDTATIHAARADGPLFEER